GREPLEERMAFLATDLADAVARLADWARGGEPAGVWHGRAKRPSEEVARARESGELDALLARAVDARDWSALGRFFTGGATPPWHLYWEKSYVPRVALPTYPFARQRCWIPTPEPGDEPASVSGATETSAASAETVPPAAPAGQVSLSLMFFSDTSQVEAGNRYDLVLEAARFADRHGFEAIWTPERHFHPFGGIYSSPATLTAALAATTQRVRLRAGSVVLPLEDPLRVAEAWAVVDNLSGGRVDLGFASGWNPNDFALAPDAYAKL